MRFLEVADGDSINIEQITRVSRVDQLTSRVSTMFESFDVVLPYHIILQYLQEEEKDNALEIKQAENIDKMYNVMKTLGHFAG